MHARDAEVVLLALMPKVQEIAAPYVASNAQLADDLASSIDAALRRVRSLQEHNGVGNTQPAL